MTQAWKLLAVSHFVAFSTGYVIAPREMLETEVKQSGLFRVDTKRVLSAAVESLRSENKLLVLTWKSSATVSIERRVLWLFEGRQVLVVPATISYLVDLSALTLDDVAFDERARVVTVHLPPLVMSEVSFEPEAARAIHGGVLSFNQTQVDELSKLNYANARKAFVKQAQGLALVKAAKQAAKEAVEASLEVPFRAAGRPDIEVVAVFGT